MPGKAEANINPEELQAVALELYSKSDVRGFTEETVALNAFKRAKVFLETAAKVLSGELSADAVKELPYEEIDVPVYKQLSDEKWAPLIDEVTNRPVMEKQPVDRFAYAPNLADDHPINVRFRPLDGIRPAHRNKLIASRN